VQERGYVVVADAESVRFHKAAKANRQATYYGPPHPMDGQTLEQILKAIDELGEKA
jgi:hypothetical protein